MTGRLGKERKTMALFKNLHTGEFREVMLIRGFEDLETFKKQYGIQDQITKEY